MLRLLAVLAVLAAGAQALRTTPALATTKINTIGPTGMLIGSGHAVRATVLIDCTAGEQIEFTLALLQGDTSGTGHGAGICTGNLTSYAVTVPARSGAFTAGLAHACATAVNRDRGIVVDTKEWCRDVGVTLTSP